MEVCGCCAQSERGEATAGRKDEEGGREVEGGREGEGGKKGRKEKTSRGGMEGKGGKVEEGKERETGKENGEHRSRKHKKKVPIWKPRVSLRLLPGCEMTLTGLREAGKEGRRKLNLDTHE